MKRIITIEIGDAVEVTQDEPVTTEETRLRQALHQSEMCRREEAADHAADRKHWGRRANDLDRLVDASEAAQQVLRSRMNAAEVDRDKALADLEALRKSFNELHRRIQRTEGAAAKKVTHEGCRKELERVREGRNTDLRREVDRLRKEVEVVRDGYGGAVLRAEKAEAETQTIVQEVLLRERARIEDMCIRARDLEEAEHRLHLYKVRQLICDLSKRRTDRVPAGAP